MSWPTTCAGDAGLVKPTKVLSLKQENLKYIKKDYAFNFIYLSSSENRKDFTVFT
jgi:hypothetical protein